MNTRTQVKVVSKDGKSALVEYTYNDELLRKFIPTEELGDRYVLDSVLEKGIPFGYPWDEINLSFDSYKFSTEMRQRGIWTPEDALKNPQELWSALNATLADNISNILVTAKSEIRSNHNE